MPANKNALIRYKTIDNCLRNHYRRCWVNWYCQKSTRQVKLNGFLYK